MRMPSIPLPSEMAEVARRATRLAAIHLSRFAFALLCALSATYWFLCSLPFTHPNLVKSGHIPWPPGFLAVAP